MLDIELTRRDKRPGASGCVSVSCVHMGHADISVGVWEDGRVGSIRGSRERQTDYGATFRGTKVIVQAGGLDGYEPFIVKTIEFRQARKPCVTQEQTVKFSRSWEPLAKANVQVAFPLYFRVLRGNRKACLLNHEQRSTHDEYVVRTMT